MGKEQAMDSTRRGRSAAVRLGLTGVVVSAVLLTVGSPGLSMADPQADGQHAQHEATLALVSAAPAAGMTDSAAADLRVALNHLLGEHVYLAARATGAALNG